MIPTVRVPNPRDPSQYMRINAQDYRPMVHGELWPEQDEGFAGLPAIKPQAMDPAVRDLAASLMVDSMDLMQSHKGQPSFSSLSPQEQLTILREAQRDMKESREKYHRANQVSDADLKRRRDEELKDEAARIASEDRAKVIEAQRAQVIPPGVVPGQTPGWPLDLDSGLPLVLTDAERAKLSADAAAVPTDGAETSQEAFERSAGQGNPAEAPATPSWAAQPAAPTPAEATGNTLSVSKGPGNKWYVMRGNSPVTEGFATKAEAETAKANVPAA